MGRRSDPIRVAAAAISGVAERVALLGRTPDAEALVEIRENLARLPADRRQAALDEAAAAFIDSERPGAVRWLPVALALLARAGADLERAKVLRAARGGRGLSGLGEQAARLR
jgi:hypothetical protein